MRRIFQSGNKQADYYFGLISNEIDALKQSIKSYGSTTGIAGQKGDIRFIKGIDDFGYLEYVGEDDVYVSFDECFRRKRKGGNPLELKELTVDRLYAKAFIARQINAPNGDFLFSDSAVVEEVYGTQITFKTENNLNVNPFSANDLIVSRVIKADKSAEIRYVKATVNSSTGREIVITYTSTDKFEVGDTVVRVGNTTDASRRDSIFISTNLANTPYIDIYDGITTFAGFDAQAPKTRIGKLSGISDSDFGGALTGYGIYAQNAYLKGKISLANNGFINLGKTAYNDTTNAGFWLGDSDATATINPYFYLGNASDTKYLKVDTVAGTFSTLGFTITGGTIQTATSGQRVVIDGSSNSVTFYNATSGSGALSGVYYGALPTIQSSVWFTAPQLYASSYFVGSEYRVEDTGSGTSTYITQGNGFLNIAGAFKSSTAKFHVDSNGNIVKLRDVTYSFPSVAPTLNQVLKCTNTTGGVLEWATITATVDQTANYDWTGNHSFNKPIYLYTMTDPLATNYLFADGNVLYWRDAAHPTPPREVAFISDLSSYVPTSRTLTINGTGYDLSANRSYSVGTVTSVSAGIGMNFTTITSSGSVALGVPSTLTAATTNSVSGTTHTHEVTGFLTPSSTIDYSKITAGLSTGYMYFAGGESGIASTIPETNISFTDVTTGDASTSKHGFLPKLNNNAAQFLNGQGAWATPSGGGTVTSIATSSPITGGTITTTGTIGINDAVADGSTKGAASFDANDFNSSSGNISIDYTNGQAASAGAKGFLTSTDWSTFDGKLTPVYGELYDNIATSTITTNGSTYVKWTGSTVGETSGVTGSTVNDNLTINTGNGGKYKVNYSVTFTADATDAYYWTINASGSAVGKARQFVECTGGAYVQISGTAIVSLAASATVDLGCFSTSGRTVTVIYANLSITKVGN